MITYETFSAFATTVKLDGKKVGQIREVTSRSYLPATLGYRYYPRNGKMGELFGSIRECKDDIEGVKDRACVPVAMI